MGTDSGTCTTDSLDPKWRSKYMPFCSGAVQYTACVPTYQTISPSREFPQGRWYNFTISEKDQWIRTATLDHIHERERLERNKTLRRLNIDEYGEKGDIIRRFYKRPDCKNAYKNYMCYINFPRCDITRDLSLPTCRSACENFFIGCNYERKLWRCGKSKYFNGYEPEKPFKFDTSTGSEVYLRDYFPGQPFRDNKFTKNNNQIAVCTPAITGDGYRRNDYNWVILFAILTVIIYLTTYM